MIPHTHTVVPFLLAMFVAVAGMPTHVFQICRRSIGTLEVEPWREKSLSAVVRAVSRLTAWMAAVLRFAVPSATAAAVLLALLAADLSASHEGIVRFATIPLVGLTVTQLREKRAEALREAEAQRGADGKFETDEKRTQFDAKMDEFDTIDAKIRELEAAPPAVDQKAVRDAAIADERGRAQGIRDAVRVAKLEGAFADDMVKRGITLDAARGEIFAKLASQSDETKIDGRGGVQFGEDARDKWVRGGVNWLLVRAGVADIVAKHEKVTIEKIDAGEFRGLTLMDLAKESLHRAGVAVRGLDRMDIAGRAMAYRANYQTTSDFATLLENAMHKVLRAAYAIQPDTWSRWCGIGTVSDFRTHNWYRTGALSVLDDKNEHGEFVNKAIPDGQKSTFSVGTKGNVIAITREVIVNDDLGAVMRLTEGLGRAGKLTVEKAAYALLGQNSGLGPTQSDAQPLFHANRANVGTAAAISMAALDADASVMAVQTDPNGQEILDLMPAVLLVARGLQGTARAINEAEYDPDTTGKLQKPNIVKGLFRDIVGTGRLTGTRRYLFADPAVAPVFLVSFLEGQREPVLETKDGWRVDGVEMKARLDVGVNAVDYRGAVTNAGA